MPCRGFVVSCEFVRKQILVFCELLNFLYLMKLLFLVNLLRLVDLLRMQTQHGEHRGDWESLLWEHELYQSRWQLWSLHTGMRAYLIS